MKRMVVLLGICCAILSGCDITTEGNRESTNPSLYQGVGHNEQQAFVVFESLDKYEDFCESGNMLVPETFVYYRQIAGIGDFYACMGCGLEYGTKFTLRWCRYTLKDELDRPFTITYQTEMGQFPDTEVLRINPDDMRSTLDRHSEGLMCQRDGIIYEYDALGKLERICWDANGACFSLMLEDASSSYLPNMESNFSEFEPDPNGTFVERMLCLESAPAAVEEFAQMISTPYAPEGEVVP